MNDLEKPTMKVSEPYWNYHEVINYIEKKYNIQTRGYIPQTGFTSEQLKKQQDPYLDFWHWVIKHHNNIHNGCYFTLYYDPDDEDTPVWVREILKMIFDEFEPDFSEMKMFVSW